MNSWLHEQLAAQGCGQREHQKRQKGTKSMQGSPPLGCLEH
jgi:hypothetical protein